MLAQHILSTLVHRNAQPTDTNLIDDKNRKAYRPFHTEAKSLKTFRLSVRDALQPNGRCVAKLNAKLEPDRHCLQDCQSDG
jgi:hypothetical protein